MSGRTGKQLLLELGTEARFHRQRSECASRAAEWVATHTNFGGLVEADHIAAWNFADLGAAMYVDNSLESAVLGASFTNWIAVLDDLLEESPASVAALRQAHLADAPSNGRWSALVAAWRDLAAQLGANRARSFQLRLRDVVARFFDAQAWEMRVRQERRVPALAEFAAQRFRNGGMGVYLLILERDCGAPLADDVTAAEWFVALNASIGNLACYAHDLLSFEWDCDNDNPINLVRVIGAGGPPDWNAAWAHFVNGWRAMQQLRARALADCPANSALAAYLNALPQIVVGVFAWQDETRRYEPDLTRR